MKPTNSLSLLSLHAAVLLFGLSGVLARSAEASSVTLAGGRVLCSSAVLFLLLKLRRLSLRARSRRDSRLSAAGGALLAVHWVSFFQAVQSASVAIGTITYATFPLFLLVLEPLLWREPFERRNLLPAALLITGVLITAWPFSLEGSTLPGIAWGMLSALTYALLTLCNRELAAHYSGTWVSFREQSTAAVLLLPLMLYLRSPVTLRDAGIIAAIGIICTAAAFSLFVTAQKHVSAQTAGLIAGLETVYGIVFALLFLREVPAAQEVIGGCVILLSAASVTRRMNA